MTFKFTVTEACVPGGGQSQWVRDGPESGPGCCHVTGTVAIMTRMIMMPARC